MGKSQMITIQRSLLEWCLDIAKEYQCESSWKNNIPYYRRQVEELDSNIKFLESILMNKTIKKEDIE